jgi:hypothetical protein
VLVPRKCPKCARDGKFLEASSCNAIVSYYRCAVCCHVWCYSNDDRLGIPRDVTVAAPDRDLDPLSVPALG